MGAQHRGRWDLLRLARSSAAGQGVLVLLDCLEPLHGLQSLEHGIAVQVIDLVLQAHAEQITRGLIANKVGIQVIRLDDDMVGTLNLAANARDGKAALAKGHQMVALLNNDRVDEHIRIVVVLVAVVAVDGDELNKLANLRGSQAAAAGVISSMTAHSWRRRGSGDSTIPLASMAILSGCYIKS